MKKEMLLEEVESMCSVETVRVNIKACKERIKEAEQGYNTCELSLDELKFFKRLLNKRLKQLIA